MRKVKVGRKGRNYVRKPKIQYGGKSYSKRNARVKANRIKKAMEKNNLYLERQAEKRRIAAREKRNKDALDKKRKDWKTQAKNKQKYEKRKVKAISKVQKKPVYDWKKRMYY